jgi:hypothetical protein
MRTRPKKFRSWCAVAILLIAGTVPGAYAADIVVGTGFGFSLSVAGHPDIRTLLPLPSYEPKWGSMSSIGVVLPRHSSLLAEVLVQGYDRLFVFDPNPHGVLAGLGAALEFRLFADIRKTLNPYGRIGMGLLFRTSSISPSTGEDYPTAVSLRLGIGARLRLAKAFYFDPSVSFFSGSSSLLFQAGLAVVL